MLLCVYIIPADSLSPKDQLPSRNKRNTSSIAVKIARATFDRPLQDKCCCEIPVLVCSKFKYSISA